MRIASWNVNSVKARQTRLLAWLQRHQPDILCLQELKGIEESFPKDEVEALGYQCAIFGQKTYNGVAILAREQPTDIERGLGDLMDDPEARLISARVGQLQILCVYVPNGQSPVSAKFRYKLEWLQRLRGYLEERCQPDQELVVCGDFNCAVGELDVHDPGQWAGSVLTHQKIRDALGALGDWGLVDTYRQKNPGQRAYSWWDYRMLGFPKNRGLRIDMIFATAPLAARCTGAWIDREERKGTKPSDHAPVVAEF